MASLSGAAVTTVAIPWTEKYRPSRFDDIVLDPTNKQFFLNMLREQYFPNLLLYGPPGTGKTTTIINLINAYQSIYQATLQRQNMFRRGGGGGGGDSTQDTKCSREEMDRIVREAVSSKQTSPKNKSLVIHLNASDERGIDIIRNQIYQFVKTSNLFESGLKFVILDEVDYMTKNAQQALKYLLQTCGSNVKFCLICNYISKIEQSLQNEFICIRFNQLPQQKIHDFIQDICRQEQLVLDSAATQVIQNLYRSDIRSMINFIQLNQQSMIAAASQRIIHDAVWEQLRTVFCECEYLLEHRHVRAAMKQISIQYNIDKKQILKDYFNFLVKRHPEDCTDDFLESIVEPLLFF